MPIATPFENAFYILAGINTNTLASKQQAYQVLKDITGQDFGYDPVAWLEYGIRERFCLILDEVDLAEFKKEWEANKHGDE